MNVNLLTMSVLSGVNNKINKAMSETSVFLNKEKETMLIPLYGKAMETRKGDLLYVE